MIPNMSGPIEYLIVDFDRTLIRENLLIEWVFAILSEPGGNSRQRLRFLVKSLSRGIMSIVLSRYFGPSERAVRIACNTFRGIETRSLHDLILKKRGWKGGYAINLNTEVAAMIGEILAAARERRSVEPKIIISSQGSFTSAIRLFLNRQDVVQQMAKAGIHALRTDKCSIIANRLEVFDDRFTGRLIPPVVTKHIRLEFFPPNALFIGDREDEAAIKRSGMSSLAFINHRKASAFNS
ncbi:MAG: hypothetical protein RBS57_16870 [Desulforhabdus sp.]|nr:hypothetical protein [Desulforhabdus sp.]